MGAIAPTVRNPMRETPSQRIVGVSNANGRHAQRREDAGRSMSVEVDHHVVSPAANLTHEPPPIFAFDPWALVPRKDAPQPWMPLKQPVHGLANKHIHLVLGVGGMPSFQGRSGQDHVAQKGRLNEQDRARHARKVTPRRRVDEARRSKRFFDRCSPFALR